MVRDYRTLDAIVITGSLAILGGSIAALVVTKIPSEQLAVFSGAIGTIGGYILGYTSWRWAGGPKRTDAPGATITTPPGPSTITVDTPESKT